MATATTESCLAHCASRALKTRVYFSWGYNPECKVTSVIRVKSLILRGVVTSEFAPSVVSSAHASRAL